MMDNERMTHHYSRVIHFADTDAAGVVYFANLLSICHEAYEDSLTATGIDLKSFFSNSQQAIPIVHASIDFYKPLVCGDRIFIQLTPKRINPTEFEMTYQLFREEVLVAQALTRHVCIDVNQRKRQPLSTEISNWLEKLINRSIS